MANRAEVLENLKKAASEGNIREAYRDFEELPFVDQVAISISPGIGDALAAFEVGEFSARGAKNIKDKATQIKIVEVAKLLTELSKTDKVDSENLVDLLQYYELVKEIKVANGAQV